MTATDPVLLLAAPLAVALFALLAAAAYYDFTVFRRRRKNKYRTTFRCNACRCIYTAERRTPLARCPRCGHQNEPVRH